MTHHTRQSALGLPYIKTKTFGGKEYQVSEYTMAYTCCTHWGASSRYLP